MNKKKFVFKFPSFSLKLGVLGSFRLPVLSGARLPLPGGLYLGGGKLMFVGFGAVLAGFLASTFVMISSGEEEIVWPQVGAVYKAP